MRRAWLLGVTAFVALVLAGCANRVAGPTIAASIGDPSSTTHALDLLEYDLNHATTADYASIYAPSVTFVQNVHPGGTGAPMTWTESRGDIISDANSLIRYGDRARGESFSQRRVSTSGANVVVLAHETSTFLAPSSVSRSCVSDDEITLTSINGHWLIIKFRSGLQYDATNPGVVPAGRCAVERG